MRQLVALAPKVRHDLCRPIGPTGYRDVGSPPSRTGLLIAGPSDLEHDVLKLN
jgi:hypothetical protein